MKLNLSANLRRLRVAKGITQEDLAEILNVSHKAISRWETGAAYPDIEMIPTLAEHFGVSLEELLGTTNADRERASEEYYDKWRSIANDDNETIIEFLREMHREFPRDENPLESLCEILNCEIINGGKPELLDELRRYTDEMVALKGIYDSEAQYVIMLLIQAEKDEYIQPILEKYTSPEVLSRENMLESRYKTRGEHDKHRLAHQDALLRAVKSVYEHIGSSDPYVDVNKSIWVAKKKLALIDLLTDNADPTVPDLWFHDRIDAMIRLSCYLAETGESENALSTLESAVDLYEKFWNMPNGTALSYRCPALSAITGTVEYEVSSFFDANNNGIETFFDTRRIIRNTGKNDFINPALDMGPLTDEHGWEWFDSIRDDERYKKCIDRMNKLLNTRTDNSK